MDSKRQLEIVGLISDHRFIVAKCFAEVKMISTNIHQPFLSYKMSQFVCQQLF